MNDTKANHMPTRSERWEQPEPVCPWCGTHCEPPAEEGYAYLRCPACKCLYECHTKTETTCTTRPTTSTHERVNAPASALLGWTCSLCGEHTAHYICTACLAYICGDCERRHRSCCDTYMEVMEQADGRAAEA